jgi:hypothetical protein
MNDLDLNKMIIKMKNISKDKCKQLEKRNQRQLHIKPKKRVLVKTDDKNKNDNM